LVAAIEDDVAGLELDHLPGRLDQPAGFRVERREQAIAGEGLVGLHEFVSFYFCHGPFAFGSSANRYDGGPSSRDNHAKSRKFRR
jgi:hypothetical protein